MYVCMYVLYVLPTNITVVARVSKHATAGIGIGVVAAGTTIRTRIG